MSFVLSPYCPTILRLEAACNARDNDQYPCQDGENLVNEKLLLAV